VIRAGAAALGSVLTMAVGRSPGMILGWLLIAGTAAAALAVEWRRGYLLIPVPALAYLLAAAAA